MRDQVGCRSGLPAEDGVRGYAVPRTGVKVSVAVDQGVTTMEIQRKEGDGMRKPKENTILYTLRHACDGIENDVTRRTYKRGAEGFAVFLRGVGITKPSAAPKEKGMELLQEYEKSLEADGKRPETIHTYLAGAACALGNVHGCRYSLKDIKKPKRGEITKGRDPMMNYQGKVDKVRPEFSRLVNFAECVGIRRDEYRRIDGRSYRPDESGYMCVWVKGKGGKVQAQRVLPWAAPVVNAAMTPVQGKEKLFSKAEMDNKIDLHSIRRSVARKAYDYYLYRIQTDPAYREQLQRELLARFDSMHPHDRPKADKAARAAFVRNIMRKEYICRGANAQKLRDQRRNVTFDRLAVMAVSVFHLSHWRPDVTVKSYLV